MNTYLFASVENSWLLAGWTMIHFLWLGTLVGLTALVCRWLLRRASADVRYATSLACLALLAALPVAIATWLLQIPPPFKEGEGGRFANVNSQIQVATLPEVSPIDLAAIETTQNPEARTSNAIPLATAHTSETSALPIALTTTDSLSLAISTLNASVRYLPWLWLIGTPITFALTTTGLLGTRRLRRASRPITDGPIVETLEKLAASLRLTRRVAVAVCDRIAAPVLIGILRPIILLPPAALTGYSPDEIEMVLLHELAHVRRWDNLVNLMQRLVESLLFFHPAVWLISSWVRREREACCDALVVTRTDRPHAYAELLVALAAQMPRSVLFHPAASSAMAAGPLRSRIRRILKLDDDPMLISGKSFMLMVVALLVAAMLAVVYLPSIGQAEQAQAQAKENTEAATPAKKSVRDKEKAGRQETRDKSQKKLLEVQGEIKRKYEDYLDIAKGLGRPQDNDQDPEIDLLLRDIAEARKKVEDLTTRYYQLQTDYMVARGNLSDPRLIESQAEEALEQDTQYANLQQQLGNARGVPGGGSDAQADSINRKLEQYRADFKKTAAQEMQSKPNVPLQQLTQRFRAQATSMQKQIALLTHNLEQKRNELEKQVEKSVDLETRGEELKKLQQIANDMNVMLEGVDVDVEAPEPPTDARSRDTANENSDAARFQGFEKALKDGVEIIIVLFNGQPEFSSQLEKTHAELAKNLRSLYTFGIKANPASDQSKRYRLTSAPTCVVFVKGKEVARLDVIESGVQLSQFVRGTIASADSKGAGQGGAAATAKAHQSKFPTLEDQKLADLVWKRLQLEIEPINENDLKRVKAFSYEGGVKVTDIPNPSNRAYQYNEVQPDDILVGLHVWPTTSFQDIAVVLKRDDLQELAPLKFYIVRPGRSQNGGFASEPKEDAVITGRISVKLPESGFRTGGQFPSQSDYFYKPAPSRQAEELKPASDPGHESGSKSSVKPQPPVAVQLAPTSNASPYSALLTPARPRPATEPAPNSYIPRVAIAPQSTLPTPTFEPGPNQTPYTPTLQPATPQASQPPIQAQPTFPSEPSPGPPMTPQDEKRNRPFYLVLFYHPDDSDPMDKFGTQMEILRRESPGLLDGTAINVERDAAIAEAYKVRKFPTYILYHNRKEVARLVGHQATDELQKALQNVKAKHENASAPQPVQPATPKREAKTTAPLGAGVVPHGDQLVVAEPSNDSSRATTPSPVPADPSPSPSTKRRGVATLTPAESIFNAYDIPPDLKDKVLKYFDKSSPTEVRIMGDDRGRYIVQATQAWHDNFAALLKAAPKWHDPAVAKERADALLVMKKTDDEDILEWRSVGLSLRRNTEPRSYSMANRTGVAVAAVAPGSPAAWADIRPGDIVTEIGRFKAGTMPEVQSLLKALGEGFQARKNVRVKFYRQMPNGSSFVDADFTLGPEDLGANPAAPQDPKPIAATQTRPAAVNKAHFRYDGKTFKDWRDVWKTELSTEKRLEAVKALAAFGANGYGPEAAEAIVEIAGQYDWTSIGGNDASDTLKKACLGAFGYPGVFMVARPIPENDALLALLTAVDSQNTNDRLFAAWVLPVFSSQNKLAAEALVKLSSDADAKVRSYSFRAMNVDSRAPRDRGIPPRIPRELMSNDPQTARSAIKSLVKDAAWFNSRGISMEKGPALLYAPELFPLLFAPDESVRRESRQALRFVTAADAPQIIEQLLSLLGDDARQVDHIEAIRALAAMGPKASPALDKLTNMLSTSDAKMRIASAAAIKMIVGKDRYQKPVADVLGEELGIKVVETGGIWGALPRNNSANADAFNKFTEDVISEQELLFPPEVPKRAR